MKDKRIKIVKYILMILVVCILCCGCDKNQDIQNVINKNVEALQNEDINAYMQTIDKNSLDYYETKKIVQQIFKLYDLKYEIKKISVTSLEKGQAIVKVDQITKRVSGSDFIDNEMTLVHTLKKIEGKWKFSSTTIQKRKEIK